MPEPQTADSIATAKQAQQFERVHAVAALLASYNDVTLSTASARVCEHYLTIADAAVYGAARPKGLSL